MKRLLAFCNSFISIRVLLEVRFNIFRRMLPTYEADIAIVLAYLLCSLNYIFRLKLGDL